MLYGLVRRLHRFFHLLKQLLGSQLGLILQSEKKKHSKRLISKVPVGIFFSVFNDGPLKLDETTRGRCVAGVHPERH